MSVPFSERVTSASTIAPANGVPSSSRMRPAMNAAGHEREIEIGRRAAAAATAIGVGVMLRPWRRLCGAYPVRVTETV